MANLKWQNYNSNVKTNIKYRAYQFSLAIIRFITEFPKEQTLWIIKDQLLRCATSVGANIIEAQSSSSRKEFIKFYEIALKSANETKYWLSLLGDSNLIRKEKTEELLKEIKELSNMIGASLLTLKGKRKI